MPEILPVHNGNNHWHSLIFKDNGVGSQSSFLNPYSAKTFQSPVTLVVTDPHHLPGSHIREPQSRIWAVDGEKTKKDFSI